MRFGLPFGWGTIGELNCEAPQGGVGTLPRGSATELDKRAPWWEVLAAMRKCLALRNVGRLFLHRMREIGHGLGNVYA